MKVSPFDQLFFNIEDSGMALACSIASTHRKLVLGLHACEEKPGSLDALVAGVEEGYRALL